MRNLYRALFPAARGHVLLGRRLRPFSSWHLVQLQYAESPLVGGPGEIDLPALSVAASVCVTSFPQRFQSPTALEIYRYRRCLRRCARDVHALPLELIAWRQYIRDSSATPALFTRSGAKACQCPPALAVWAALKLRGFSEADAWDMPVGKASWYKEALAESEGAEINLMTDAARRAMIERGYGFMFGVEDE